MPNESSKRGIATKYGGIWFRSRIEARWAAFFDLVGWKWDYEPLDLEGYLPDFLLHLHKPIIVEVKPAPSLEALYEYVDKIESSGWGGEALLLGTGPFAGTTGMAVEAIGILDGPWKHGVGHDWSDAAYFHCMVCDRPSLCHAANSFACRVCGGDDHHMRAATPLDAWREACNITQWRPTAGARIQKERAEAKRALEFKPQLSDLSARLWAALDPTRKGWKP